MSDSILSMKDHQPMSEEALKDLRHRASGLLALKGESPEVETFFTQMAEDINRVITECLVHRKIIAMDVQIDAMALARKQTLLDEMAVKKKKWESDFYSAKDLIADWCRNGVIKLTIEQAWKEVEDRVADYKPNR